MRQTTNLLYITVCESVLVKEVVFVFVRLCACIPVCLVYVSCIRPPPDSGVFFHRCYFSQPTVIPKCFSAECFSKQSSLVPRALFTRASATLRFNMPPLIC